MWRRQRMLRLLGALAAALCLAAATLTPEVASASSSVPRAVAVSNVPTVGALFTRSSKGRLLAHFCTGSVVHSPTGTLVLTAAHCVSGRRADSIAFVPGYVQGEAPLGVWRISRVVVDRPWSSDNDADDDVALLVVKALKGHPIESVTGANVLGARSPTGVRVRVIAYPNNAAVPISCVNVVGSYSRTQLQFNCDGYTDGTSGGPLLAVEGGAPTVIGVIGGFEQGGLTPSVSYAAKFGANVASLLASVTRS